MVPSDLTPEEQREFNKAFERELRREENNAWAALTDAVAQRKSRPWSTSTPPTPSSLRARVREDAAAQEQRPGKLPVGEFALGLLVAAEFVTPFEAAPIRAWIEKEHL
jgi:hypothetical protein